MTYLAYELKDTAKMMQSGNYKERFKAEYYQAKIRYEKLKDFNNKIEAGENWDEAPGIPVHDCPTALLRDQQRIMGEYLHVLEIRAVIEEIEL